MKRERYGFYLRQSRPGEMQDPTMTYVPSIKNAIEDARKMVPPPDGIDYPAHGNYDIAFVWRYYADESIEQR